jgi:hypothetical protein
MLFTNIHMLKLCYLQMSICYAYMNSNWHILKILKLNYSVTINGISLNLFSWTTQWLYMAYILILTGFFKSFLVGVLTVYICVVKSSHLNWHNWMHLIFFSTRCKWIVIHLIFRPPHVGGCPPRPQSTLWESASATGRRYAWKPGT